MMSESTTNQQGLTETYADVTIGNQGSIMIIPRERVMVPGFHVMKFDTYQDGLQVRGQVILDIASRSEERVDCNLCGVTNMDVETYEFHKKTQFHMENLGDTLICSEEGFVTPIGKCPPRTPPAPRRLRNAEEEVRDYPAVSLNNARRELIDEEDVVSFSLSQELDEVAPAPVPTDSEPIVTITNANAEEVKDILRRAFVTDFFRTLRAQGNNGRNKKFLIERAIETWHQYFSQYLVFENKKKLVFLLESVLKEYGKDFKFNKIENICRALNYVIPRNGVLMAFHRNEEEVFTRKTLVSEKDFQEESATPETCYSEEEEEKTPDADSELFIVDDDDDTIIDDEAFPEVDIPKPIIPDAVVPDSVISEADEAIPDAVVAGPSVIPEAIPDAVVPDPVIPEAIPEAVVDDSVVDDSVVEVVEEDCQPEYEDDVVIDANVVEVEEDCQPEYEEEIKEGFHEYCYGDGVFYKGNYIDDSRSGYGECEYPDVGIYKGNWRDDKRHGHGVMTWKDKAKYEGQWENDSENGIGKMTLPNGDVYEGEWKDGWKHGQGVYHFFNNDKVTYDGEWREDKEHGYGTLTLSDGTVQKSTWVKGKKSKKRKSVTENKESGYKIKKIKGDGNCTFRALAYLIYGDECYHLLLRRVCYETVIAEGSQDLLEKEEKDNWAKFGIHGGPVAIETIARLYGCQVNVIDSKKKSMNGNGPYNENEGNPVLTLVYSPGHYDAYSNGVFNFTSAKFSDKHRENIGSFENKILNCKGGQVNSDQVLLTGSLEFENAQYNIMDVAYAKSNWLTLPPESVLALPNGLYQHTAGSNFGVFDYFDNDDGYHTKKKPQQTQQYLYYYQIEENNWICGLMATEIQEETRYIKRAKKTCCECGVSKSFKWNLRGNNKYYCDGCY